MRARRPTRPGHLAVCKLFAALLEGPQTIAELVDVSGLCDTTVSGYVRALRREGAAHISCWRLDERDRLTVPVYALGKGRDAARRHAPLIDNATKLRRRYARDKYHRVLHALAA